MVRAPAFDPIQYLVGRRFQLFHGCNELISSLFGGDPLEHAEEREAYEASLRQKSATEIATLVAEEQAKERIEAQVRAKQQEAQRFFNGPNSSPDYDHYCLCANWTLDEAVALSFGKNPEIVNTKTLAPLIQVSPFAKAYAKRRDIVERAKWAQQLFDPVLPSIFLAWAKSRFQLPDKLTSTAVDCGISLKGWHDLYEDAIRNWKAEVENLNSAHFSELAAARAALGDQMRHISELQDRLAATSKEEKPLETRERENLQMLALVGAMKGYGYDPDRRTGAVKDIEKDLERLDHQFRDDRIRHHLQKAAEGLRPGWRDRLALKPNSVSK